MKKMKLMEFLLISLFIQSGTAVCKYIIVSQRSGSHDSIVCGKDNMPCQTLGYAVLRVANNNDTILIESGNSTNSYSYTTQIPIFIKESLHIQSRNSTKVVFKTNGNSLFLMVCRRYCSFTLSSVILKGNLFAVTFMKGFQGSIQIHNSMILTKVAVFSVPRNPLHIKFKMVSTITSTLVLNGDIDFQAKNCIFNINRLFLSLHTVSEENQIFVQFQNCSINNGTITSYSSLSSSRKKTKTLLFQNTIFSNIGINVQHLNEIHIINSHFKDKNNLAVDYGSSYYIPFVQVFNVSNVTITESSFTRSLYGAVAVSTCKNVLLSTSTFINNTKKAWDAQGGGAVLSLISNIRIEQCLFVKNTAHRGGGTIHHEGGKLILIDSTIGFDELTQLSSVILGHSRGLLRNVTILGFENNSLQAKGSIFSLSPFNIDFKYMGTWELQFPFSVKCPKNSQINSVFVKKNNGDPETKFSDLSISCNPCTDGSYSFDNGYQYINKSNGTLINHEISCLDCPPEAHCANGQILNKGSSWGYVVNGKVRFIPCPTFYCCSKFTTPCDTYNTCSKGRHETLCGACLKDYQVSLFGTKCIKQKDCSSSMSHVFWLLYALSAFLFVYILMFLKDIFRVLKRLFCERKNKHDNVCMEPLLDDWTIISQSDTELLERSNSNVGEYTSDFSDETAVDPSHSTDGTATELGYHLMMSKEDEQSDILPSTLEYISSGITSEESNVIAGLVKIIFHFYQVQFLLRVNAPAKNQIDVLPNLPFIDFIVSVFNLKIISVGTISMNICPVQGLTMVGKRLIMASVPLVFLIVIAVSYLLNHLYVYCVHAYLNKKLSTINSMNDNNVNDNIGNISNNNRAPTSAIHTTHQKLTLPVRLQSCMVQILLLGYLTITLFLCNAIHCVSVDVKDQKVLYIQGDVNCYHLWQQLAFILFIIWALPFPIVLHFAYKMLQKNIISANQFLGVLFMPPLIVYFKYVEVRRDSCYKRKHDQRLQQKSRRQQQQQQQLSHDLNNNEYKEKLRQHIIQIISEPFRQSRSREGNVVWESILLSRRLCLLLIYVFIIAPIGKVYLLLVTLLICLVHHGFVNPYSKKSLNVLETASLSLLCILCSMNLFWAYSYAMDTASLPHFKIVGKVFLLVETFSLVLPIVLIIVYYFGDIIRRKLKYSKQE